MNSSPTIALMLLFAAGLLAFGIYTTVTVWSECRANNSFLYCMTLVSRK